VHEKAKRSVTIADVLRGRVALVDALIEHPLGIRTVAGHRSLNDEALPAEQLHAVFEPIRDSVDLILLDTHPHEPSLLGPMSVADRIVIPTALDILSLRAAALTVGLAQQLGVLEKILGIVVTNAKRPMSRITESLLNGLRLSGLAFETVLWYSSGWVLATSGRGELPEAELLDQTKALLREVAVRSSPVEPLQRFIAMAQGRRPTVTPGPGAPALATTAPAFSG
jgi:hypothetical protein